VKAASTGWTTSPILNERVLVSTVAVRGFPLEVLVGAHRGRGVRPVAQRGLAHLPADRAHVGRHAALIALAAWGLARREGALQRKQRQFPRDDRAQLDGVI